MKPEVKCPAAEEAHPLFSRNDMDVRCRIQGGLRPAAVEGTPAICCDEYFKCRIWQTAKQIEEGQSTGDQRRQLVSAPHSGVLKGATRDRITVT
jgi:hypothetical protein